MLYSRSLALVRHTPLLHLDRIYEGPGELYGKLDLFQPAGSVKDRAAAQVIADAHETGLLRAGQPVVEMTSGNMGAGLAFVCKQWGNPFTAVMSKGNSPERVRAMRAFGADVVLVDQLDGEPGRVTGRDLQAAMDHAEKLAAETGAYYVDQFNNESGVKAHYRTTGPEIFQDLPEIDAFVACVGSGGTFVGTSRYLKEQNPAIKCIAVEPANAAVLSTGVPNKGAHIIQGTGYGFVPPKWDASVADEILTVSDGEVRASALRLSREQGLYCGYSAGANVAVAARYLRAHPELKRVATMICDTGYKYSDL